MNLSSFWDDLRFAARSLARSPGFALAAVLSLALGIGANTAIFSLVNAMWLRPLPVSDPDRLVVFYSRPAPKPGFRPIVADTTGPEQYTKLREGTRTLSGIAAESGQIVEDFKPRPTLPTGEELSALPVSVNYFEVLGVPVRGRGFVQADDEPGAPAVAIISHSAWRSRFGADPALLGHTIHLSGIPVVMIGVAAEGFQGPRLGDRTDVWIPIQAAPNFIPELPPRGIRDVGPVVTRQLRLYGRLRPDVTLLQAQAEAQAGARSNQIVVLKSLADTAYPVRAQAFEGKDQSLMALLFATAILVLVVGCVNLAGLLIARAERRRYELGVRLALGISRGRLVRLLASEALLLSLAGSITAIVVSRMVLASLAVFSLPTGLEIGSLDLGIDWRVAVFTAGVSVLVAAICGTAPAFHASRLDIARILNASRTSGSRARTRSLLLAGHAALATVLLVGAGLFAESVRRAYSTELGFDSRRAAFLTVTPNLVSYATNDFKDIDFARRRMDIELLKGRLRGLGGVKSVTEGVSPLLSPASQDDRPPLRAVSADGAAFQVPLVTLSVGAGYCNTVGIPLLSGRDLTDLDAQQGAPPVAVVSERIAVTLWGSSEHAVGSSLSIGPMSSLSSTQPAAGQRASQKMPLAIAEAVQGVQVQVVGVAGESTRRGLRGGEVFAVYRPRVRNPDPSSDMGSPGVGFAIGTTTNVDGVLPAITASVREIFPNSRMVRLVTAEQEIASQMMSERMGARLFAWFSLVALALCLIGIWGLVAYHVARRTHELGVRLALGARPRALVTRMAIAGLRPVAVGCLAGLAASAATTRLIASYLYDVSPLDPVTFSASAIVFVAVAALASLLPARRVLAVNPIDILRSE